MRPDVRDKTNVYGPGNDYEVIKTTMSDVLTRQGDSPEKVAETGQKVADKMQLLKDREKLTPAITPKPAPGSKDGPER